MNRDNNTSLVTTGIKLLGTGSCHPLKKVTNDDLSKIVDTNDEWITTRTGIKSRYYCEDETATSLAVNASKIAIENASRLYSDFKKEDIGVVLVATSTSDYVFPSTACMLQNSLELTENVIAFDMAAACTGFIYAIEAARGLLLTGKGKYALVVGSEQMTKVLDFEDRGSCVLFGDGAGAVVMSLSDSCYLHVAHARGNISSLSCEGPGNKPSKLAMNGKEVFMFAVKAVEDTINEILTKSEMSMDDIDYVVCHQANKRIIDHVKKKYKGSEDKFFLNIENYANTSAASVPIALHEMDSAGMLKEGMKIIVVGFGGGLTWSGALITV